MNNNKHLKPKLLDPIIEKKIIKTLKPVKEDYWAPTKNGFRTAYENYIRPNFFLVFFIILIILFLIYRYRIISNRRQIAKIEKSLDTLDGSQVSSYTIDKKNHSNTNNDNYTELLLYLYNDQKEKMREPPTKSNNISPKFAYPMYPYARGGSLSPSNSK